MQENLQKKQETSNVVSDTSPLITLKHAGLLEELSLLFLRNNSSPKYYERA